MREINLAKYADLVRSSFKWQIFKREQIGHRPFCKKKVVSIYVKHCDKSFGTIIASNPLCLTVAQILSTIKFGIFAKRRVNIQVEQNILKPRLVYMF